MKYRKAILSLLMIFIFLLVSISASIAARRTYPKQQFGFGYSGVSGAGLSWQMELSPQWAIKANGFAYYFGKNPPDNLNIYTIIGGELQYNLYKTEESRLYALVGGSRWYFEERSVESFTINDKTTIIKHKKNDNISNLGLGIGYEYLIFEKVAISFDIDYLYQTSFKNHFSILADRSPNGTIFNGATLGFGLRFKL